MPALRKQANITQCSSVVTLIESKTTGPFLLCVLFLKFWTSMSTIIAITLYPNAEQQIRRGFNLSWFLLLTNCLTSYCYISCKNTFFVVPCTNGLQAYGTNPACSFGRKYLDWLNVTSGVPQGSILRPIFFILYMNDLPEYITPPTEMALYADDSKLYRVIKSDDVANSRQTWIACTAGAIDDVWLQHPQV